MHLVTFATILLYFVGIVKAEDISIVSGCEGDTPEQIVSRAGKSGAAATSYNLMCLTKMLCEKNLPNAYCFGWDGDQCVYVVWPNGCVAPYNLSEKSTSMYAFVNGGAQQCPAPNPPCPAPKPPCPY